MIETEVHAFVLVLSRVSGFVAVMPVFGGRNLPRLVNVAMALAFSVMWFVLYHDAIVGNLAISPNSNAPLVLAWHGMRELVIGVMLGFTLSLFIEPAKVAGAYIGQELGLTLATVNDPATRTANNVFSQLFEALAVLIFLSCNLHHAMIVAMHVSFSRLPIGTGTINVPFPWLAAAVQATHEQGLVIAAPIGGCLFLIVVLMALLSKVAPQMNIFSIGLSIRLALGLLAVIIFLPTTILLMRRVLMQLRLDIEQLLTLL